MRSAINHDSGQPVVDFIDVEDRMRPVFLHFFWPIITTGFFRVVTCTRWLLEDVGWAYSIIVTEDLSPSGKHRFSHPTSKTHGQSEDRSVDTDAQKPRSMRQNHACRQRQETSLSTPVDFPSRTSIVVTIFHIVLPELVQPAPIRVPRILFASDRKNLFEQGLMKR
jgi:hypothetical protein